MRAKKRYMKALSRFLSFQEEMGDPDYEVERLKHFLRQYIAACNKKGVEVDFVVNPQLLVKLLLIS